MISKDILWKGIIEDLFEDFLLFFFPQYVDQIDFSKGFEFLDKELQKIQPDNNSKRRFADKLVKVFLKNGKEKWILVHVEIQGYFEKAFGKRMYIYHYRIFEKFQKSVTALAIYTDKKPNFHPKGYSMELWGTSVNYTFNTYKLMEKELADFEKDANNPFSIVMKTAWIALKEKDEVDFLDLKINLARQLMKKGFSKSKTNRVLNFIGHYIRLQNPKEIRTFESEIDSLTKPRQAMGIIEGIREELKRQAIEKGLQEGLQKGLEKGLQKGLQQGIEQGIEQGEANGMKKTQATTIVNSLNMGLSADIIAGLLNISKEELPSLVKELISSGFLEKDQVASLLDDSQL